MNERINVYQNLKSPTVKSTITFEDWISQIQSSSLSVEIENARETMTKDELDEFKANFPCVTYNFLYDGYKNDKNNLVASTGLLYIDIDIPDFETESLDLSKVYCAYRSFSGKNCSVVVKADGITKNNFKESYFNICEQLGISSAVDKIAVKASQFSVLSYDKNLFYNPTASIFHVFEKDPRPQYMLLLPMLQTTGCVLNLMPVINELGLII